MVKINLKIDFLKIDLTHNEGIWGRNGICKNKKMFKMYTGTEITVTSRQQKIYIIFLNVES